MTAHWPSIGVLLGAAFRSSQDLASWAFPIQLLCELVLEARIDDLPPAVCKYTWEKSSRVFCTQIIRRFFTAPRDPCGDPSSSGRRRGSFSPELLVLLAATAVGSSIMPSPTPVCCKLSGCFGTSTGSISRTCCRSRAFIALCADWCAADCNACVYWAIGIEACCTCVAWGLACCMAGRFPIPSRIPQPRPP